MDEFCSSDSESNKVYFSIRDLYAALIYKFPLRLENLEKWEGCLLSVRQFRFMNRLEKSGINHTQIHGKLRDYFRQLLFAIFLVIS